MEWFGWLTKPHLQVSFLDHIIMITEMIFVGVPGLLVWALKDEFKTDFRCSLLRAEEAMQREQNKAQSLLGHCSTRQDAASGGKLMSPIENLTVNGKGYGDGEAAFIAAAADQLRGYRKTTPKPDELEWEIRVYEYILAQPDPISAAKEYLDAREHVSHGRPLSKRETVKKLGWVIL